MIYKKLFSVLLEPIEDREEIQKEDSFAVSSYINKYFSGFDVLKYKSIGAIVMNCNPFTNGHRYLIEEAIKQVDFLIIFVVEENKSIFTFAERMAMVCSGVADLKNIKVVPSGEYILSDSTFPEYFLKTEDEDIVENTKNDIIIFAEYIASRLNISYRFVGEEPEDIVTNIYNSTMKKVLPTYGIRVIEIPRKKSVCGEAISASRVRRCLEENNSRVLKQLVPDSTMKILHFLNS